ncbi:hypothetical protein Taro_031369 [Colocasia esculenta]|uniref:KIB1-4 beta-propeller domain-containing protein n=1 Tax=Colocasia esculenta TaxID=4460 RepID=A0A843VNQ6_COLES|nr:hypothetical protein [Colocasia esculenta]
MKSLLPAFPTDVFSAACVCRAWRSVFTACRRDLLSSMPPLAVHEDLTASPAVKAEGHWRLEGREPPLGAARPWARAGILGASHGHLFVVDAEAERSRSQIILLEAVAAVTGEETPVIRLPWIPLDPYYLDVLLMAHPTSPQCVVVALVNENLLLCCRVGDRRWIGVHLRDDGVPAHIPELCATMLIRSVVAVDGKVYAMTELGKLLIVKSFLPQLNISVLDVGGIPPEDPFPLCFMVESGGDILCMLDDPDEVMDISGMGPEAWADGHRNFVAYRLDLPARQWVRADDALGDDSRALLLNYYGDSLSWEAGGSGDKGRDYARCWGSDSELITVYHMKHGLVEHRGVPFARYYAKEGLRTCLIIQSQDSTAESLMGCKIGKSPVICNENLSALRLETTKMILEPLDRMKKADARINFTQGILEGEKNLGFYLRWIPLSQPWKLLIFLGRKRNTRTKILTSSFIITTTSSRATVDAKPEQLATPPPPPLPPL